MIYLDKKILRDTKEFSSMIAKEKTFIRHNIKTQKAIQNTLLNYINRISNHSYNIPLKDQDTAIKFLQYSKKCFHVCTKNLHRLEVLLSEIKVLDYEYKNTKDKEKLIKFSDYYIKTMVKVSKYTFEIEKFLSAISSHSLLTFSNSNISKKSTRKNLKKMSKKEALDRSKKNTKKNIKKVSKKEALDFPEKNIDNISKKEAIDLSEKITEKNINNSSGKEAINDSEKNIDNIFEKDAIDLSEKITEKNINNTSRKEAINDSEKNTEKNIDNISEKDAVDLSEKITEKNINNTSGKEAINDSEKNTEKNIDNISEKDAVTLSEKVTEKKLDNISEKNAVTLSEKVTEKNIDNISEKNAVDLSKKVTEKKLENISEKDAVAPSEKVTEKKLENISEKEATALSEASVDINDENRYQDNILLVSETKGKVILPYKMSTLKTELEGNSDKYSNLDDLIAKRYTLPYTNFKNVPFARFRETYNLVRNKEHGSIKEAFLLGMELFFNYNLHPAIIAACKSQDELDIYLDYLDTNETSKFDCFKIVFDILPKIKATKQKNQLFE